MKKKFIGVILLSVIVSFFSLTKVRAAYNYGPNGVTIASSECMVVSQTIDSSNLVNTDGTLVTNYSFGFLSDIATYEDKIYMADADNNLILVLNEQFQLLESFPNATVTTLKKPEGLYVTKDYIYVCDYGNNRVAIFNHNYELVQEVLTPDDLAFENYEFRPKKITVNRTGRMFVIAEGINEGIIDFNPDGTFSRYYGMNSITLTGWAAFWQIFTSEEQKKQQALLFGASLTNLCVDDYEYIYTVSSANNSMKVIKKLNYKGSDILVRNGYVDQNGDANIIEDSDENIPTGPSNFIDIDVNEFGNYIALDNTRNRIFCYDFEGNLLYIGSTSTGGVASSSAYKAQQLEGICYFKDKVLVIDSKNKNLLVFSFTNFGNLVNQATELYYNDQEIEAATVWNEVLKINTNYYLAYAGIGKAQLRQGDYVSAMENLKLGYDDYNYSRAYQQYRYDRMSVIFPYILGTVIALGLFGLGKKIYKGIKHPVEEESDE